MNHIENYNSQYSSNFNMVFNKNPELNFFLQKINLPGIQLGEIHTPWQNHNGYFPDNRIEFESLNGVFILDENMETYFYLINWMRDISDKGKLKDHFQDSTLLITTNNRNENKKFTFIDCFPTSLSSIDLDSGLNDVEPLIFSATFRFQLYYLEYLTE